MLRQRGIEWGCVSYDWLIDKLCSCESLDKSVPMKVGCVLEQSCIVTGHEPCSSVLSLREHFPFNLYNDNLRFPFIQGSKALDLKNSLALPL